MKIGLYTRNIEPEAQQQLQQLIDALQENHVAIESIASSSDVATPSSALSLKSNHYDFILSIGGDGTLLSSVHLIGNSGIPVVGVNFGHLGFLTTVNRTAVRQLVANLLEGHYAIEERSLLHVSLTAQGASQPSPMASYALSPYALNEVNLHRRENISLMRTNLFVDDEFVATYDGDGLIVATPTGSTAYSLSCGGPILTPNSGCFVITPIGAHTLTLRPIIVPDSAHIRLVPSDDEFNLAMDSCSCLLPGNTEINLAREDFTIRLVRMNNQSFFTAIHEKLAWGTGLR